MSRIPVCLGVLFLVVIAAASQRVPPSPSGLALQSLLDGYDYMEFARRLPETRGLTPEEALYFQGILAYRQGRFKDAVKPLISAVNTPGTSLTSEQVENALETLGDTATKTYQYASSVEMYDNVDKVFGARMGDGIRPVREKRAIAAALQKVPPQTVQIAGDFSLKKAGMQYPVNIGGKEFSAALDSGAPFSLLSESAAKEWGVNLLDGTVTFHGYGGDPFIPAYSANRLPLWFGSVMVFLNGQHVLGESQGGEAENFFGLIGQDLLQQFASYTIDFRTMRFSVSP